jgi:hypothetical protein
MKKLLISTLLFLLSANMAHASLFGDLIPSAMIAKEMAKVDIPLDAIKKQDARIKIIETLAARVAIKHKWQIQVACPSDSYCQELKESIHNAAWRVARSQVKSDYVAKTKMPKIKVVRGRGYSIRLITKGM